MCLKCHGRMERVLPRCFNSTNMVGSLPRLSRTEPEHPLSRPTRRKRSPAGAPPWIARRHHPNLFCLFVCFSSGTPLCEKGNRGPSIRSHGLTADARHNELIGGGGVCLSRVWHAGGRRGRRAQAVGSPRRACVHACMHACVRLCEKEGC